MSHSIRTARATSRIRQFVAPVVALIAVGFAGVASASTDLQAKPEIKVEANRSPEGARLDFRGKGFPAGATLKITGTRAPGANAIQDFGTTKADSTGAFQHRKTAPCTTSSIDDAREAVTVTVLDAASGTKATAKVDGSSWVCQ